MVWDALVSISHSCDKRLMAESLRLSNGIRLRSVVGICHPSSVCVFQNVVSDRASFWATLGFRFYKNVSHDKLLVVAFVRLEVLFPVQSQVGKPFVRLVYVGQGDELAA